MWSLIDYFDVWGSEGDYTVNDQIVVMKNIPLTDLIDINDNNAILNWLREIDYLGDMSENDEFEITGGDHWIEISCSRDGLPLGCLVREE